MQKNEFFPENCTECIRELFWLPEEAVEEYFELKNRIFHLRQKIKKKQPLVEKLEYQLHL